MTPAPPNKFFKGLMFAIPLGAVCWGVVYVMYVYMAHLIFP